jgi:hypothetical protein
MIDGLPARAARPGLVWSAVSQHQAPVAVNEEMRTGTIWVGPESWEATRESEAVAPWRGDDEGGTSGPSDCLAIQAAPVGAGAPGRWLVTGEEDCAPNEASGPAPNEASGPAPNEATRKLGKAPNEAIGKMGKALNQAIGKMGKALNQAGS